MPRTNVLPGVDKFCADRRIPGRPVDEPVTIGGDLPPDHQHQRQSRQHQRGHHRERKRHADRVADQPIDDRRDRARPDRAGVEDAERARALLRRDHQRHRAVEHRRRAVERDADQRAAAPARIRAADGSSARMPSAVKPSVSHTVATTPMRAPIQAQTSLPAAPPTKTKRQRKSDGRQRCALGGQQERQEGEEAHAGRRVDHADREQHGKSARCLAGCDDRLRRGGHRCFRPDSAASAAGLRAPPQARARRGSRATERHGITTTSSEAAAGSAIFPRSPAKL